MSFLIHGASFLGQVACVKSYICKRIKPIRCSTDRIKFIHLQFCFINPYFSYLLVKKRIIIPLFLQCPFFLQFLFKKKVLKVFDLKSPFLTSDSDSACRITLKNVPLELFLVGSVCFCVYFSTSKFREKSSFLRKKLLIDEERLCYLKTTPNSDSNFLEVIFL